MDGVTVITIKVQWASILDCYPVVILSCPDVIMTGKFSVQFSISRVGGSIPKLFGLRTVNAYTFQSFEHLAALCCNSHELRLNGCRKK